MARELYNRFGSNKEYLNVAARSTGLFDSKLYSNLKDDAQTEYLQMIAGTREVKDNKFNSFMYENLTDPQDRLNYIATSFYDQNNIEAKQYFDQMVARNINRKIYENSTPMKKILSSIGAVTGAAVNETVLGTIEGLIDLSLLLVGASNEKIAADTTGVNANRNALLDFSEKYTYIDKLQGWRIANDVLTGLGRLTVNFIPGVGQILYFAGMAGNIAEQTVRDNPEVDRVRLLGYTAASTAVELATEMLFESAFLPGFFKLPAGTTGARRVLQMGFQEAVEEGIAEIANTILYHHIIDKSQPILPSLEEVAYAALIGGLIGGIGAGGQIMSTPGQKVAIDPNTGQPIVIKGKSNVLAFNELVSESIKQIEELKKDPSNVDGNIIQAVVALNKVYEKVGAEGFGKILDLTQQAIQLKEQQIVLWQEASTQKINPDIGRVISNFEKTHPKQSFLISKDINQGMSNFGKTLNEKTGYTVMFGEFVALEGVPDFSGVYLFGDTIFISEKAATKLGSKIILDSIISQENTRMTSKILGLSAVEKLFDEYVKIFPQNAKMFMKGEKSQWQSIFIQNLLTDTFTAEILYKRDNDSFNKVAEYYDARARVIKNDPERKSAYLKLVNKFFDIALQNSTSYEQFLKTKIGAGKSLTLEEYEALEQKRTKRKDTIYRNFLVPFDISMESISKLKGVQELFRNSNNVFAKEIDTNRIYDPTYYNEQFLKELGEKYPGVKDFKDLLSKHLLEEYNLFFHGELKMFFVPIEFETLGLSDTFIETLMGDLTSEKVNKIKLEDYVGSEFKSFFKGVEIEFSKKYIIDTEGGYFHDSKKIVINGTDNPSEVKRRLIHELNHALYFNFFDGARSLSSRDIIEIVNKNKSKIEEKLKQGDVGYHVYLMDFVETFANTFALGDDVTGFHVRKTQNGISIVGRGKLFGVDFHFNRDGNLKTDSDVIASMDNTLHHKEVYWNPRFDAAVESMLNTYSSIEISDHVLNNFNIEHKRQYGKLLDMETLKATLKNKYYLFEFDTANSKFAARFEYDKVNDVAIVLSPHYVDKLKVVTMWLNEKTDTHKTLNKSRYNQPPMSGKITGDKIANLTNIVIDNGGATIDPISREPVSFKDGYQVSIRDLYSVDEDSVQDYLQKAFLERRRTTSEFSDDVYVGAFYNDRKGLYDIDFSINIKDLDEAKRIGRQLNQDYLWDWANQTVIPLKEDVVSAEMSAEQAEVRKPPKEPKEMNKVTGNKVVDNIIRTIEPVLIGSEIRVTETQGKNKASDKIRYASLTLKTLINHSSHILKRINNDNVGEILAALSNKTIPMTQYQRTTANAIVDYLELNYRKFNRENREKIAKLYQTQKNEAGIALSRASEIAAAADPIASMSNQIFERYGIDLENDPEFTVLNEAMQDAQMRKDWKQMNELNGKMVQRITELIGSKATQYDFWKGTAEERKRKFKNLIDGVLGFRYLAMLSNFSTHIGNYISNYGQTQVNKVTNTFAGMFETMFGEGYDGDNKLLRKLIPTKNDMAGQIRFIPEDKISQETRNFVKEQLVDSGWLDNLMFQASSKFAGLANSQLREARNASMYKNKILQWVHNVEMKSLQGVDNLFTKTQLVRNLENIVEANHKGDFSKITPLQMEAYVDAALDMSMELYFRSKNPFADWWITTMEKHWALKVVMGGLLPFQTVASNIMIQVYKMSPLHLVQTITTHLKGNTQGATDFYAKLSRQYGQATTGTILMIMGVVLAELGVLGVDKDEFDKVVLNVGDARIRLSQLAPSGSPILLGAALMSVEESGLESLLGSFYDQTLLDNFNSLFQYNSSLEDALIISPLQSYVSQYIPALLKSITKVIDPNVKDTRGEFRFLKRLATGLPIISNLTVENRVNPYTGEVLKRSQGGLGDKIGFDWVSFLNLFLPTKIVYEDSNYLKKQAELVGAETSGATGRFTINGESYSLTGSKLVDFASIRGNVVERMMGDLINSQKYMKMTQDEKYKEFQQIYDKASQYAKIQYWIKMGNRYVFGTPQSLREFRQYVGFVPGVTSSSNHRGSRFISKK